MNLVTQQKIGDLFKISKGKKSEEDSSSNLRYIQIDDLRNDNKIKLAKADVKNVTCTKLDVLIAWDGANAGTVGYDLEGVIGSTLAKLVPQNNDVDSHYAGRFLQSKFRYLRDNCTGATIPHISKPSLVNLTIPLPPLKDQKKIAEILDAADSLRQKDQQLVEHYDRLSQSLFLDMFGDPVSNSKRWNTSKIKNILEKKTQNGLYLTKDKYIENGIEMVHMSDAFYDVVEPGSLKKVVLTKEELEKYQLSQTDLLLARRSLTYEGAAKPCRIPEYDKPLVYESSLIKITPNIELINTTYLYYFFSNDRARNKYINQYITKSTISGINNKNLNFIDILLPPIELQNTFAENVLKIEKQKKLAQQNLKKSDELFNSLLQQAFKGELTDS